MGYLLSLALCTQFGCSCSFELHYQSVRVTVCVVGGKQVVLVVHLGTVYTRHAL